MMQFIKKGRHSIVTRWVVHHGNSGSRVIRLGLMTWRNQWRENGAGGPRKVLGERSSLSVEGGVSATGGGRRIGVL